MVVEVILGVVAMRVAKQAYQADHKSIVLGYYSMPMRMAASLAPAATQPVDECAAQNVIVGSKIKRVIESPDLHSSQVHA